MFIKFSKQAPNRYKYLLLVDALLVAITLGGIPSQAARADTITVCTAGCDFSTIQAAIDDGSTSTGDVININDAVHTEAGILVAKDVTIQGQGADNTIVQAHATPNTASDRVFFISNSANVTIRDLTIRHGNPISEPESGGGIRNEGTLKLENVVVRDNSGSAGGGILNDGTLTLINCTVSDNEARGGGVHYIECSTGGGIKNMAGVSTVINSTISDNEAEGKGGGFHIACHGILVLVNSTVSGNTAARNGGGIYLNGVGKFTNSTISNNSARNGGGIFIEGTGENALIRGQLDYTNTLIANNTARLEKYGVADCVVGEYASIGVNINNLVGDNQCDPSFSGDPMLAPLSGSMDPSTDITTGADVEAGTGFKSQAHALLPGSPAIDAIPAEMCEVTADQWGISRPQGSGCDIGAFELPQEPVGITDNLNYVIVIGMVLILTVVIGGLAISWQRRELSRKTGHPE